MSVGYANIRDVAGHFKVSVSTVRNWVKAGKIPADTYIKVGDTYRFNLDRVEGALLHASDEPNESTNNDSEENN